MPYIILGVAAVLLGGLAAMLSITLPISRRVYEFQLVRTEKSKWGRACSAPENEDQLKMWEDGCLWAEENAGAMQEVCIQNDGFDLYGEFYDFGSKRCVLILPGRCESLMYSYYFAQPYQKAGCNVLVIDTRCHGKSGGTHNSIGKKESRDVIAWAKFLEKTYGITEIFLHCICIGSASGMLALTSKNCPASITKIVAEGCFTTFRETFKTHMIAQNRPLFPVLDLVMLRIFFATGTNVLRSSPIAAVKKLKADILFLQSRQDIFSTPEKAKLLFKRCASPNKQLVWFDEGSHSHVRVCNKDAYDSAILSFLQSGS